MADDTTRSLLPDTLPPGGTGGADDPTRAPDPDDPFPEPLPPAVPAPGGRYALGEELARGGMGVVYRATDTVLGREVAVKVLQEKFGPGSAAARRFLDEARITARLQHPGVPAVHDLGVLADGRPFLAMKLIRGETLESLLKADREDRSPTPPLTGEGLPTPPSPTPHAAETARAAEARHAGPNGKGVGGLGSSPGRLVAAFEHICQAVGFAHAQGIIHRDLKPSNVMVGGFGEVQVMDWGLARVSANPGRRRRGAAPFHPVADAPGSPESTESGSVVGTPQYMSPEQARGDPADERADVFGLGAVLCVILTGRPPFVAADAESTRKLAARGELGDCFAGLDDCGAEPELVALAKRCLAPDPADRPADAGAVADAVAELRAAAEDRARRAEVERGRAEGQAAEQRKRRKVQLALAGAVLLMTAGGLAFGWWADRQAADRKAERERAEVERVAGEVMRAARNEEAIGLLLAGADEAMAAGDTGRAAAALDEATQRAATGAGPHAARLARARADLELLRALDRIDGLRWTVVNGNPPAAAHMAAEYAAAFRAYGIVPGVTPPGEVARRLAPSPLRERLLTALDLWHAAGRPAGLAAALKAIDRDVYRDAVREAIGRNEEARVRSLAALPAALEQPPGFAPVLGLSPAVPHRRRVEILRAAHRQRPRDFTLLMALADAHEYSALADPGALPTLRFAWRDERVGWYHAALAVRPDTAVAWNNLGNALGDRKDHGGAVAALAEAVRLNPTDAAFHTNLGAALAAVGDLNAAAAVHRRALALDPKNAPAHLNLGNALRDQGRRADALAAYRRAIELDPKSAAAHLQIGGVLREAGDLDGAVAAYRKAIRLDPAYPLAHNHLGVALGAKGDEAGALAAFAEAVRLRPGEANFMFNLGLALEKQREWGGAVAAFEAAVRLNPADEAVRAALDRARRAKAEWDGKGEPAPTPREGKADPAPPPREVKP